MKANSPTNSWFPLICLLATLGSIVVLSNIFYRFPAGNDPTNIEVKKFFHPVDSGTCPCVGEQESPASKPAATQPAATQPADTQAADTQAADTKAAKTHPSESDRTKMTSLSGLHVWAAASLLQLLATVATIFSAWNYGGFKPKFWCKLLIRRRFWLILDVVLLAALVSIAYCVSQVGVILDPISVPGIVHGKMFKHAFTLSGRENLVYVVGIGTLLAVLLGWFVVWSVFFNLCRCRTRKMTTSDVLSERAPAENEKDRRTFDSDVGYTCCFHFANKCTCPFPARLHFLSKLLHSCETQADAATLAAGTALTSLLIVFFGAVSIVIGNRVNEFNKAVSSRDGALAEKHEYHIGIFNSLKLLLPLLASLVAQSLGTQIIK